MEKDFNYINKMITNALARLGETNLNFGIPADGQRNPFGESLFQERLCHILNTSCTGWVWSREEIFTFTPRLLVNEEEMAIDIVGVRDGEAILIELKYVTTRLNKGWVLNPHDPYAFPYDVLKDCLKIELAVNGLAQPTRKITPIYGVSIGLTNYCQHWGQVNRIGLNSWTQNYLRALWSTDGAVPDMIRTVGQSDEMLRNAVFKNHRYHLSFSWPWTLNWHDYSGADAAANGSGQFRYIFLHTADTTNLDYPHVGECDANWFVPFTTEVANGGAD